MEWFKNAIVQVTKSMDVIARVLFLLIMLLVVGNVIFRMFGRPFDGSYEWVGFMMGTAISFSLAYCALREGHIAIGILVERLGGKIRQAVLLLEKLLSFFFLALTVRMILLYGNRMLESGHVGMNTGVPLYYFAYIIAFGFLVYCLVLIYNLVDGAEKMIKR